MGTRLALAAPSGPMDFFIRVVKAFVASALSGTTIASFTSLDQVEAMLFAGGTAAYSVVLNGVLAWAKD